MIMPAGMWLTQFLMQRHFLCKWHVKKAWGKKKNGLAGKQEFQREIYRIVKTLIHEKDQKDSNSYSHLSLLDNRKNVLIL